MVLSDGPPNTHCSDAGEGEVRQIKMPQHFAHSMSVANAMNPTDLLCYELNGEPLPQPHGFSLRLIAPGLERDCQRQLAQAH